MPRQNRILVVDDEERNLVMLGGMLASLGHTPVVAASGAEALDLVENEIHAALLDAIMPGMDGFELARRIRNRFTGSELPIIMVTILQEREDRIKAVESGANDFISKPVSMLELRVRLGSLLDLQAAHAELRRRRDHLQVEVERRASELYALETKFRTVFESASDAIFVKDTDLRYTHVNPAMVRLLECDPEEILGRGDDILAHPTEAQRIRRLEGRVLRGRVVETEHTLKLANGRIRYSCVRAPLKDSTGKILGLCGIMRDLKDRIEPAWEAPSDDYRYPSLLMRPTLRDVRTVAATDATVLFLGESGSGKDFLAKYLHMTSSRNAGPFISVNCAALSKDIAESELFGHEKGAFTGASFRKRGLVELAEGGTLLLNEIGELSAEIQAKLLTFLDTRTFLRVGGQEEIETDARIISATNRDLAAEAAAGRFRQDLYYRLNVVTIRAPALRERTEDMRVLAGELLYELTRRLGLPSVPDISDEAVESLKRYHWPGNVRELRNVLERTLIVGGGKPVDRVPLDPEELAQAPRSSAELVWIAGSQADGNLDETIERVRSYLIEEALTRSEGNVTQAAKVLGVSRDKVRYYLKRTERSGKFPRS